MFELPVQQAIFIALSNGMSCGVYDDVPDLPAGMPDNRFPYVVIGDDDMAAWDTDDILGAEVTIYLHFWSKAQGYKELKGLMGEAYQILNRSNLTIDGFNIVDCLYEYSNVLLENNKIRHGVQRFILTIEEN